MPVKLYVIPVESYCNAKCFFCVTKLRHQAKFGQFMSLSDLDKIKGLSPQKIEITGGGDPSLHPQISEIIISLSQLAPTQMYTNGLILKKISQSSLQSLTKLCISRAHYDFSTNTRLMGVGIRNNEYLQEISQITHLKMSALLCQSGLNSQPDIDKYIQWALSLGAKEIVFRKMFDLIYPSKYKNEPDVNMQKIILDIKNNYKITLETSEKINFIGHGLPIELELRSCACELSNPILRPNGKLYIGWGENELV